jgi:hypothetical protein
MFSLIHKLEEVSKQVNEGTMEGLKRGPLKDSERPWMYLLALVLSLTSQVTLG